MDTDILLLVLEHACAQRYSGLVDAIAMIFGERQVVIDDSTVVGRRHALFLLERALAETQTNLIDIEHCFHVLQRFALSSGLAGTADVASLAEQFQIQKVLRPLGERGPVTEVGLESFLAEVRGLKGTSLTTAEVFSDAEDILLNQANWRATWKAATPEARSFRGRVSAALQSLFSSHPWFTFCRNMAAFCRKVEMHLPASSELMAKHTAAVAAEPVTQHDRLTTILRTSFRTDILAEALQALREVEGFASPARAPPSPPRVPSSPLHALPSPPRAAASPLRAPRASVLVSPVTAAQAPDPEGTPTSPALPAPVLPAATQVATSAPPAPAYIPPSPTQVAAPEAGEEVEVDVVGGEEEGERVAKRLRNVDENPWGSPPASSSLEARLEEFLDERPRVPTPPPVTAPPATRAGEASAVDSPAPQPQRRGLFARGPNATQVKFDSDDEAGGGGAAAVASVRRVRVMTNAEVVSLQHRRKPFSVKEEMTLRDGVERLGAGNWKDILDAYQHVFVGRTTVNLKDKWRNMNKDA